MDENGGKSKEVDWNRPNGSEWSRNRLKGKKGPSGLSKGLRWGGSGCLEREESLPSKKKVEGQLNSTGTDGAHHCGKCGFSVEEEKWRASGCCGTKGGKTLPHNERKRGVLARKKQRAAHG